MKSTRIIVAVLLLAGLGTHAEAALIFGSIGASGASLRNHDLTITCGSGSYTARTDERGSYGVKPGEKGKCTLSLSYEGQALSYPVFSQEKPARYDLEIVRGEDGRWMMRRR